MLRFYTLQYAVNSEKLNIWIPYASPTVNGWKVYAGHHGLVFQSGVALMIRLVLRLYGGLLCACCGLALFALLAGKMLPYMGEMAYISTDHVFNRIYLMDVQRGISLYQERTYVNDCCLTWSPDGQKLTLVVDMSSDGSTDIFTMDMKGPPLRLTSATGADLYPVWSPDSQQIAYTSFGYGDPQIYLMNPDGSQQHRITGSQKLVNLNPRPVWSANGRSVLFSDFGNVDSLFAVPADCTEPCDAAIHMDFSTNGLALMTTNFLPVDENRILLAAFDQTGKGGYGVYVLDKVSGKTPEMLTINPDLASPAVAIYNNWIAFVSGDANPAGENNTSNLYMIDSACIGAAEGCAGELQKIATQVNPDDNLSWSPDGRWLAFVTYINRTSQLNLLDTSCLQTAEDCSGSIRTLPITSIRYIRPAWRPSIR